MPRLGAGVRRLLTAAASTAGYRVFVHRDDPRTDWITIDRFWLSSYYRRSRRRQDYDEALRASQMEWSDNFPKQSRFDVLEQLADQAVRRDVNADVAECGCWKGTSTYLIAKTIERAGFQGRFHVFDSFEGLSDPHAHDEDERYSLTPGQIAVRKQMLTSTEPEVRRTLAPFTFTALYPGWIPERFPDVADRRFSFVHVDVDLYEPTRDSLAFFVPRLVPGGVLVCDDYGYTGFPGAKAAVDEYVAAHPVQWFVELPMGGAFLIK
jgi:hypothetical protein